MSEDRPLQTLQSLPRLEAELLGEEAPARLVDLERLRLASRAVEGEHQLAAQAFSERMLVHEHFQLANEVGVPADGEIGVDPVLKTGQAELLQTGDLSLGEALVGKLAEGRAPPEGERLPQLAVFLEAPKALEIELLPGHAQLVAGCLRLQALLAQQLAQLRDIDLKRLLRCLGRLFLPERLD